MQWEERFHSKYGNTEGKTFSLTFYVDQVSFNAESIVQTLKRNCHCQSSEKSLTVI